MDKPIEYEQYSTRWKNIPYTITGNSRQTIGTSGCGPSSAAMVIATLRDKKITPKETCKYATENGYRTINSGTAHAFFPSIMKKYDIPCYKTYDFAKVISALKKNYMVIAAAGIGIWTRGGHIILAYGIKDNKVLINDPNSESGHRELANQSNFKNECSPFWIIEEEWQMTPEKFDEMMQGWLKERQDDDAAKWSKEGREFALESGIVQGNMTGAGWERPVTKEMMAVMLMRAINYIKKLIK